MMGKQSAPAELFDPFQLEEHVPAEHPLRALDAVLNFERVRTVLAKYSSRKGRPSIDPELMLRMLLIGYVYGIRSERQLCNEVHLNLAYRWFCRLGLTGAVPDHSTSPRTAMAGFATARFIGRCSSRLSNNAAQLVLCPAKALLWMVVSFMAMALVAGAWKPSRRFATRTPRHDP